MLFVCKMSAQGIDWKSTTNWRIYYTNDKAALNYPIEKLMSFKNALLKNDRMEYFLADVSLISVEKTPVWMGFYIATCQMKDSSIRKICISTYGGFFFDVTEKKYYELPLNLRKDWLDYFADSEAALQSKQ